MPIVILLVTGLIRRLMRSGTAFCWEDFFLGMDLTLAAFSTALVNMLDLIEPVGDTALGAAKDHAAKHTGVVAVWYIISCFIVFILLLIFHQEHSRDNNPKRLKHILYLGIASNFMGIALFGSFIYLKMKGKL